MTNLDIIRKAEDVDKMLDELIECLVKITVNRIRKMNVEQCCFLEISNFDESDIYYDFETFINPMVTRRLIKEHNLTV